MTIFNILSLIGGLAMFLFGMNTMGNNLEKVSGGKLESILERLTNTRFKGFLLGMAVTSIIQSSSAVTVMAIGFVNSQIMTLSQVSGIVMGAHVGTTITAWILSLTGIQGSGLINLLKPTTFTPILAIVGAVMLMLFKNNGKKQSVGGILIGFALLMMGMQTMSSSVEVLRDTPQFTSLFTRFTNPVLGVLAGAVLTAIVQSSSASVGILQALSTTGTITVAAAFPIILGQNIGACVPVLISAIGANKNAKRTAGIYLSFSLFGVVASMLLFYGADATIGLAFKDQIVSPVKIAVIHTVFNLFTTMILFPFGNQLEKLMCFIIRDDTEEDAKRSKLIDERFILSPSYALDKVKERCDSMANLAVKNILLCLDFIKEYNHSKDEKIKANEKKLDAFEDELETYLVKISAMNLSVYDSMRLSKYSHAIGNFERIGDYGYNILKTKRSMHRDKIHFTDEANRELEIMSQAVQEIIENATKAFIDDDAELAMTIEPLEQVINNLKAELRARHSKRIDRGECTIEHGMYFFDIINSFERIADHCSNLAVCIIELSQGSYQTHSYLKGVKSESNKSFMHDFEAYLEKYKIS